jgi:integrase
MCRCTALENFFGFFEAHGKVYGTISTYFTQVNTWRKEVGEAWTRVEVAKLLSLQHVADVRYAIAKLESAIAICSKTGDDIIKILEDQGEGLLAVALYLMALSGGRFDDLHNLAYKDMGFTDAEKGEWNVSMTFRIGKNHTRTDMAHPTRENTSACLMKRPKLMAKFAKNVAKFKSANKGLHRPFAALTTAKAGATLRTHNIKATTYCFRKHFAARIQAEYPDELEKVSQKLGHRNLHTGKAYYIGVENEKCSQEYRERSRRREGGRIKL